MANEKTTIEERMAALEAKIDKILALFEVSMKSGGEKEKPETKEQTGPEKLIALAAQNNEE